MIYGGWVPGALTAHNEHAAKCETVWSKSVFSALSITVSASAAAARETGRIGPSRWLRAVVGFKITAAAAAECTRTTRTDGRSGSDAERARE